MLGWPLALTFLLAAPGVGQDRVTWLDSRDQQVTRAGEILSYDANHLQLRLPHGATRRVPADRLVGIESERGVEHQRADEAFDRHDYSTALSLYRSAYRDEMRLWKKQQIVARSVECLQQLDRIGEAAATFLALWKQDAATPYFAAIPLAWRAKPVDRQWENVAVGWLDRSQPAVARLMAASWLLAGRHRRAAEQTLVELTEREASNWIGRLAAAQRWRTQAVTASVDEVLAWRAALTRLPAGLRAGPSFVVASGLSRWNRADEAVLLYLRIALVDAPASDLAAESLWAGGQVLERTGHGDEARRVYRELIERHPDHPLTNEAHRTVRLLEESR
jgi:tetratricopeptide (TPR) repeat protein